MSCWVCRWAAPHYLQPVFRAVVMPSSRQGDLHPGDCLIAKEKDSCGEVAYVNREWCVRDCHVCRSSCLGLPVMLYSPPIAMTRVDAAAKPSLVIPSRIRPSNSFVITSHLPPRSESMTASASGTAPGLVPFLTGGDSSPLEGCHPAKGLPTRAATRHELACGCICLRQVALKVRLEGNNRRLNRPVAGRACWCPAS